MVRSAGAGHADVLDAWLGAGTRTSDAMDTAMIHSTADWDAPRRPVELAYDTADQGLPFGVRAVGGDGHHCEGGALPEVVVADLGDADVELLGAVLHAAQDHPLVLQRLRERKVEGDGQEHHGHRLVS